MGAIKIGDPEINIEKTWPQVLAILISSLAGITNGLLYSWPSPFLVKIAQDKEQYDISEEEASYFSTIQPIAMIVVSPIFSILTDVIGRKQTLILIAIPQIASWLCAGFAKSIYVFYVSRIFAGFADGCFFAALPIYVGEISTPNIRGTWGNLVASSYYIGEFLINVIGSYFGVRATSYICLPLPVLYLIFFSMMPESPYYYIMRGEEDKARKSLIFLKRTNNIEDSFKQLQADVTRQMSESGSWSDLIRIKSNRKALIAGMFLRFSQQMSGLIVFVQFTQFIFQKSGGNISHEISSILYIGLQLGLNILVLMFIVNRFGRRVCYISSVSGAAVVLYILGTYFYVDEFTLIDISKLNWFPIASMVTYQFLASFGIAVTPTLMLSELFSASIKSKAMVVLIAVFGLGAALTNYIFYATNTLLGFYAPFYLFAIGNTASAILSYFIIPETKGKTLEEIQQSLKRNSIF